LNLSREDIANFTGLTREPSAANWPSADEGIIRLGKSGKSKFSIWLPCRIIQPEWQGNGHPVKPATAFQDVI
jgi:hypothetical protein